MRSDFATYNPSSLPAPAVSARRLNVRGSRILSNWALSFVISLTLCWLFMLMPLTFTLGASACLLLGLWGVMAWRNLLAAYSALCFVWLTYHSRTILPIGLVEGAWLRGGVGLGDLLWLLFAAVLLLKWLLQGRLPLPRRLTVPLLIPLPFIGLSVLLPLAGVLVFGYPWSYAVPGARHIQWFSFAVFAYLLVRSYGGVSVLSAFLTALALSGLLHLSYSVIQLLAFQGALPAELLLPDLEYTRRFMPEDNKLKLDRATGFTHNPNDLGLWGALAFHGALSLYLARVRSVLLVQIIGFTAGILTVLFSGSRSALLGSCVGLMLQVICFLVANPAHWLLKLSRLARSVGATLVVFTIAALGAATNLPYLVARLSKALAVLEEGIDAEENFLGRTVFWERALTAYEEQYPLGSWVAATYALQSDIDNYYIFLLVQGTPILLGTFLTLLLGYGWAAIQMVRARTPEKQFIGFFALGVLGCVVVMSIAVNPLLSSIGITAFWSVLGWIAGFWEKEPSQ